MKYIMFQGTSSHVGKSILNAAVCRILYRDGKSCMPFKAQNMALNSYVTRSGGEMGRAQVVQAEAAGMSPMVEMNPVLLKPTGNACSQVILRGVPYGNMSAKEYHEGYSLKAFEVVKECLADIRRDRMADILVIEGAGSPAEVNLKDTDIVNMRIAKYLNAPVILIGDIDRGGCLASLVGTLELLDPDERDLVKGLIINKFRGDVTLLKPAIDFLEKKTGKPVLGVIPAIDDLGIDDEDSVSLAGKSTHKEKADLVLAVLRTPKMANFTDFDSLADEPDVQFIYVQPGEPIPENADMILLPGSKNTTDDMAYLRENGYEAEILKRVKAGTPVVGICGGYQMLGQIVRDPDHTENEERDEIRGMGLLNTSTLFVGDKVMHQVTGRCHIKNFLGKSFDFDGIYGYEIHMGRTTFEDEENGNAESVDHPFTIRTRSGEKVNLEDGLVSKDGLVLGTYIHGCFDHDGFRRAVLNALRERKGLGPLPVTFSLMQKKQESYDRLAEIVRANIDMDLLYRIIDESEDGI